MTQVKALTSTGGRAAVVLGMLKHEAGGVSSLEDASGSIQMDLSHADVSHTRGFISEGSMLLFEGAVLPSGTFQVRSILEPPFESRVASSASLYGLPLFGGTPLRYSSKPVILFEPKYRAVHPDNYRF